MPRSFLVKKKRRLSQDPENGNESSDSSSAEVVEKEQSTPRAQTTEAAKIQQETTSNQYSITELSAPVFTTSYTFHHNLDTRGLHTLAELCLRRADYNPALRTSEASDLRQYKSTTDVSKGSFGLDDAVKREHDYSPVESVSESYVDERDDEEEENSNKIIDVVGESGKTEKKNAMIERLEDELEKMLQGNDEIISREIREFLDNNRPSQKEAARISELTQSEITRFLNEGLNIKDEKKMKFYRWYLGKKLSSMDPDDESFTCYKCGKIFAYQSYLERHVKYVCPDKTGRTWKCTYCSKAFQYPCYLRRHMRSHTGESPYKCTQCSRAFVRSTDLQRHLRNHTGEKPYKCNECSRAFARSTDLKRHMRTHTGEKPYKCWQCSKAFSQSGSLQTHLHTHYKESLQIKGVLSDSGKAHKS